MKKNKNSRRSFIKTTALSTVSVSLGLSAITSFAESCSTSSRLTNKNFKTGFDQTPLAYAFNALENIIDAKTMEIHYGKHAAGYSKALKEAVSAEAPAATTVEELLSHISKFSTKMRNNAGGHYNHELFWKSMRAAQQNNMPAGKLLTAINRSFGSFDALKKEMSTAGATRFGSGWAWLYVDNNKQLKVGSTPNQDNPLMNISDIKGFPLLGIDVWEHAYYLKYQNKRADYIANWWQLVNWDYVQQRYESIA